MASTWSALKIELLETGQNPGQWGNLTNVNLGDAVLGEAITGQATVDFASDADVTITLTDSATTQAARNLRLNITESSTGIGSVRNLILGSGCQIEKFYLINNTGTGAKTVKNTSGTGISVPAGKATLVFNNGTNVVDAASYFTSLTLGSALPIASGGTGTTSTTFTNLTTNVTGTLPTANGGTNLGGATPFTSGGVVYASSSSALATGSALYFDGTNLGVGNASPQALLHVGSVVEAPGFGTTSQMSYVNGTSQPEVLVRQTTNDVVVSMYADSTGGSIRTATNHPLSFITNNTEKMRLDTSGNLGIGTSSPSGLAANYTTVDIRGTTGGALRFGNATDSAYIYSDSNETNIATATNKRMIFSINTAEKMRLDTSGNLGLGAAPNLGPGAPYNVFNIGSQGGAGIIGAGTDVYFTNNVYINAGNNYFAWTGGSAYASYYNQTGGNHTWKTSTAAGTGGNVATLNTLMTLTAAGNLGIGTSSPGNFSGVTFSDSILDVNGVIQVRGDATNGIALVQIGGDTYRKAAIYTPVGTDTPYLAFSVASSGTSSNATDRMIITSAGDVGIGVTSPASKLDVVGEIRSSRSENPSYYSSILTNYSDVTTTQITTLGTVKFQAGATNDTNIYSGASTNIKFFPAGTERARITSGGDLYVGTTTGTIGTANFGIVLQGNGTIVGSRNEGAGVAVFYYGGNAGYAQILGNGNLQNSNGVYGTVSDIKLKENIVDASPKLADLMQVKVRNYNLIGDTTKQLGVVAQELETVFPAMVEEILDKDAKGNDLGTATKAVKYSVFVPMLIKAIQEQQAIIESLKARLDAANL